MIGAKVGAAHVPVEVLGFEVERKGIGQQLIEGGGNLAHGGIGQISRRVEGGGNLALRLEGPDFAHDEKLRARWLDRRLAREDRGTTWESATHAHTAWRAA